MRIQAFLEHSPVFAVRRAAQRLEADLARILHASGVSFLEALVLVSIFFEEPRAIKPSDLAMTLLTTRGNVSHCISALETRGLLRRRIDPADARALNLFLRPAGRSTAMRVIRTLDRLQRDFEKQLGLDQVRAGLASIARFEEICAARAAAVRLEQQAHRPS
jgi:DNA-binding MarR family transcriptional regulator